jgi:hypothetical protein
MEVFFVHKIPLIVHQKPSLSTEIFGHCYIVATWSDTFFGSPTLKRQEMIRPMKSPNPDEQTRKKPATGRVYPTMAGFFS